MERNECSFELEALKKLYEAEAEKLTVSLLKGATWEEVKDQRKLVTDLAIAVHKKKHSNSNPAETSMRKDL